MTSVRYAFVTLLTSDAYLPGALTVAAALNDVHRPLPSHQAVEYETVCLVTPETVDVSAIRHLRRAFNVVVGVEAIVPPDFDSLTLLGRPDLDAALTKLHVFRLTQYSKVIFLDADVLPIRPLSHLFHLEHEFSAVPDVGWPDIFNSGVMVLSPGEDRFRELRELLNTKGTWDGADQGLLNEWRGNDWNRLSFTYNTTPTAVYTYAPAYQRFGSQISAIHFIGSNKPWHSIPYRAPGSSAQHTDMPGEPSTETPATHRAYNYGSLVDRWYDVYDRHYRSQAAARLFQPIKYTSLWNEGDLRHATVVDGILGLEDLRRAALEGMGAVGILPPRISGEGDYRTMPLEGRFDLIRPRTRAERKQAQVTKDDIGTPEFTPVPIQPSPTMSEPTTPPEQVLPLPSGSPVRWTTLPTPGIHEVPPAPHVQLISLPPTPLRYVPAPYKPLRYTQEAVAQTISIPSQRQELGGADLPLTPLWNPAVETPPHVTTPALTDTYFPRVRDFDRDLLSSSPSSSEISLTAMEPGPFKPRPPLGVVSDAPLVTITPEIPRRQERYRNITSKEGGSPAPDRSRVKCVFPWEERPRRAPGRVFPDEESISATLSVTPERKTIFRSPMPSPLVGFPPLLQSHYLSDSPFPLRYAGGFPLSAPASSPLGFQKELDKAETSSQDGDVEDEVDFEEEAVMRSRPRTSSIGTARLGRKYRSIGLQTDPEDLSEEDTHVTLFVPTTKVAEKPTPVNERLGRNQVTATPSFPESPPTPTKLASVEAEGLGPYFASLAVSPSARKGSRVWDPSRGIEAFKQGSEEILARLMKKGTWGERT